MFEIKIIERKSFSKFDPDDTNISEALETIYPFDQSFIIIWNGIEIKVNYHLDGCMIFFDLKRLFDELNSDKRNKSFEINWGSQSFFAQWQFDVNGKILTIHSYWTNVGGNLVELRKTKNKTIAVDKDIFLNEWRKVLFAIKEDLIKAGYNEKNLNDFDFLINN